MPPEEGCLTIYGPGDAETMGFIEAGLDNVQDSLGRHWLSGRALRATLKHQVNSAIASKSRERRYIPRLTGCFKPLAVQQMLKKEGLLEVGSSSYKW